MSGDFDRWSSEQLLEILQAEDDRRGRIRSHADTAFAAIPALLGVWLTLMSAASSGKEARTGWISLAFAPAVILGVWALRKWYRVSRVERAKSRHRFPAVNTIVFTQHDGTNWEHDLPARYRNVRDHLIRTIDESREANQELAQLRGSAVFATFCVGAASLLTALFIIVVKEIVP